MSRKENNIKRMKVAKSDRKRERQEAVVSQVAYDNNPPEVSLDHILHLTRTDNRIRYCHEQQESQFKMLNEMKQHGAKVMPLTMSVTKEEVKSGDIGNVFLNLCEKLYDRDTVMRRRQDIRLVFHGYDRDERSLAEIPEFRSFIAKLDMAFPYMFYFAAIADKNNPIDGGFLLLLFTATCCTPCPDGRFEIINKAADRFLRHHFIHMNQIFAEFGLDESLNMKMTKQIVDSLKHYCVAA